MEAQIIQDYKYKGIPLSPAILAEVILEELEHYYSDFLKEDLKALPEKVNTLFDIAGFPHYENVISNFYSFYFDPNAKHQFGDLFISALIEVLKAKTKQTDFITNIANCFITREFCTDNGKYIDIVIVKHRKTKIWLRTQ